MIKWKNGWTVHIPAAVVAALISVLSAWGLYWLSGRASADTRIDHLETGAVLTLEWEKNHKEWADDRYIEVLGRFDRIESRAANLETKADEGLTVIRDNNRLLKKLVREH
jgi:hypothetical protein